MRKSTRAILLSFENFHNNIFANLQHVQLANPFEQGTVPLVEDDWIVSLSTSRSRSLSTTPSMVEVRRTSAAPAILFGRLAPWLTFFLILCLEPGPVASGLEASVSPDRLFGTHCRRTFEFRNCRWNVSNLYVENTFISTSLCSAHSAFVTYLNGAE